MRRLQAEWMSARLRCEIGSETMTSRNSGSHRRRNFAPPVSTEMSENMREAVIIWIKTTTAEVVL